LEIFSIFYLGVYLAGVGNLEMQTKWVIERIRVGLHNTLTVLVNWEKQKE